MKVPFFDIQRQYQLIQKDVLSEFENILHEQSLIGGEYVHAFESEISQYLGVKNASAVSSGTDALIIGLKALGVGVGDEVITPAFSFFATTSAICWIGARPVFVDVEPETLNIDPQAIEPLITNKTKVIMPVHLYGQCADMDPVLDLAKSHSLYVLEDFAQSLGAKYKEKPAGGMGNLGATSFYPTKNLGGAGEGGLVTTQSEELDSKIKLLRNHGMIERYKFDCLGTNSRLDTLQCAYLSIKLKHLDEWVLQRKNHAQRYLSELKSLESEHFVLPKVSEHCEVVWNQFVIRVKDRNRVRAQLSEKGIFTDIYYPKTIPQAPAFKDWKISKTFPVAEAAAKEVLALPIFPELNEDEQSYVIEGLKEIIQGC